MPETPRHPLGLPLTDSMRFAGGDGTAWLVYIEGVPPAPSRRWRRGAVLPDRRLRFDSACESRVVRPVPAGSPFLADDRLQELLDRSDPLQSCEPTPPAISERRGLRDRAAHGAQVTLAAMAGVSRRWQEGAPARRALWTRTQQSAAGAADRVVVWVAGVLRSRPRARF